MTQTSPAPTTAASSQDNLLEVSGVKMYFPVMSGVILQRYRQGGLSDATVFALDGGLSWQSGTRTRTQHDLAKWLGKRGQAGQPAPAGFSRNNRFS